MKQPILAVVLVCLLATAGCLGVGDGGETGTVSHQGTGWSKALVTIEDSYPEPFAVIVRDAASGVEYVNRSYDSSDHGTVDPRSEIPPETRIHVEIRSGEEVLWAGDVATSQWYELEILDDGSVDEALTEG